LGLLLEGHEGGGEGDRRTYHEWREQNPVWGGGLRRKASLGLRAESPEPLITWEKLRIY